VNHEPVVEALVLRYGEQEEGGAQDDREWCGEGACSQARGFGDRIKDAAVNGASEAEVSQHLSDVLQLQAGGRVRKAHVCV
jgi:hypothetical protein